MINGQVDEFSGWQQGSNYKIKALSGYIDSYQIDAVSRWILNDLENFSQIGDPIFVVRGTIFSEHVLGIANLNDGSVRLPSLARMFLIGWSLPLVLGLIGIATGHLLLPFLLTTISGTCLLVMHRKAIQLLNDASAKREIWRMICLRDVRAIENERWLSRPELDWNGRLLAAWRDELPYTEQSEPAMLSIPGGQFLIGDPGLLDHAVSVDVDSGQYAIRLITQQMFDRHGRSNGQTLSQVFFVLDPSREVCATKYIATIGVDSAMACLVPAQCVKPLMEAFGGGDIESFTMALAAEVEKNEGGYIGCLSIEQNAVIACLCNFGGDGSFPVLKLLDKAGATVAIGIDFGE